MVCYPWVCPTIPTMNHYGCLAQLSLPKPVGTPCTQVRGRNCGGTLINNLTSSLKIGNQNWLFLSAIESLPNNLLCKSSERSALLQMQTCNSYSCNLLTIRDLIRSLDQPNRFLIVSYYTFKTTKFTVFENETILVGFSYKLRR